MNAVYSSLRTKSSLLAMAMSCANTAEPSRTLGVQEAHTRRGRDGAAERVESAAAESAPSAKASRTKEQSATQLNYS